MPKKHKDTEHLHAIEFEEYLISSCLLSGGSNIARAIELGVREDSFYNQKHSTLWREMINLYLSGDKVEIEVLVGEMSKTGTLEEVGGLPFLVEISGRVPTSMNLDYYCEVVIDRQRRRNVQKIIDGAAEAVKDLTATPEVIAAGISNRVLDTINEQAKALTLHGAANDALKFIEQLEAGTLPEEARGYRTHLALLNESFGEIMPGELITIGARPGCGKSSIIRALCWHFAKEYGDTLLFSREMPVSGMPQLFAQQPSGVSWRDVRRGQAPRDKLDKFKASVVEVAKNNKLHINDRDRTLDQIQARVAANARTDRPLKCVAIDYLQRYDPQQRKDENRDIALGRFTMACKDMAIQHKLPVFLAAQIGRDSERNRRAPMLSDLRESGNIEQDSDRVWLLWIPESTPEGIGQDPDNDLTSVLYVEMIQAKGRSDGRAKIGLAFHRKTTTFTAWRH